MQNISLARLTHKNNYENNWRQTTTANSFSFHPLEVINQNLQWTADSQQRIVWILLQPWLTGAAAHRHSVWGLTQLIETCVINCHSLPWGREYLGLHNQTFAQSLKFHAQSPHVTLKIISMTFCVSISTEQAAKHSSSNRFFMLTKYFHVNIAQSPF